MTAPLTHPSLSAQTWAQNLCDCSTSGCRVASVSQQRQSKKKKTRCQLLEIHVDVKTFSFLFFFADSLWPPFWWQEQIRTDLTWRAAHGVVSPKSSWTLTRVCWSFRNMNNNINMNISSSKKVKHQQQKQKNIKQKCFCFVLENIAVLFQSSKLNWTENLWLSAVQFLD